jgi:hypothetical protein
MPDLSSSLRQHDLGHYHILAEHWGIELTLNDPSAALRQLVKGMLDREQAREMFETLPSAVQNALQSLIDQGGKMLWQQFTRQFGNIREMGAGRRDRERPDLSPASVAEIIWYHGLVARAFLDTPNGPLEFAYIPDDLLPYLPPPTPQQVEPTGRRAWPNERAFQTLANDLILDDACTLLALLRSELDPEAQPLRGWALKVQHTRALKEILASAGLFEKDGTVHTEQVRSFLETPRAQALADLAQSWLHSSTCNDLRLAPDLVAEGVWENEILRPRLAVLDLLTAIPGDTWWSLSALIDGAQTRHPDFLRPAGDYDSWYLRNRHTGEYLQGFNHWRQVEGAYLRYLVAGPFHWLGMLDLATPEEGAAPTAFRRSVWWDHLLNHHPPPGIRNENDVLLISSDARLRAPRLAPRVARYQVARFAEWEASYPDGYQYRLTPNSLARGRQQGLSAQLMLGVLRRYASTVPPSLAHAIERWETHGPAARLEHALILRVNSPELLKALRQSKAGRFLGDPLGPTTVIVHRNAAPRVLAILAEMGYFGEIQDASDAILTEIRSD